jgi:anti-sigma-K factor RskA
LTAQDYISSGLLEAYVLGSLPLTESEQVAGAICRFPEVAAEISALEAVLVRSAELEAVAPPADMQDRIWAAIQANGEAGATVVDTAAEAAVPREQATKIIPPGGNGSRSMPRTQAAAWVALAAGLVGCVFVLVRNNHNRQEQTIVALNSRIGEMSRQQQTLAASLDRYRREAEMAAQPGMQPIAMLSMLPGHPMAATVYWNKAKAEAYVSVQKLPPPPEGMQYQLWAISRGQAVSIGMLENEVAAAGGMQKVPMPVHDGQAFAVSLEKAGGSPSPTPDKIYLMGKMPV